MATSNIYRIFGITFPPADHRDPDDYYATAYVRGSYNAAAAYAAKYFLTGSTDGNGIYATYPIDIDEVNVADVPATQDIVNL